MDGVQRFVDMVEFDVNGFLCHACVAGETGAFEGAGDGFGARGEDVDGASDIYHLVGDHEDAELEGCHVGGCVMQ